MPDNLPPPLKKSPLRGVLLVAVIVSILISGFIFIPKAALPSLNNAREAARSANGAKNLSSIGMAMIVYADTAEKGEFPTDANQLFPALISDDRVFKRPGFPEAQDAHYMLIAGPKPEDRGVILAFEIPPSEANAAGRNVLWPEGKSEWMNEEKFKERLAATEKKLTDAKRLFRLVPINRSLLKR